VRPDLPKDTQGPDYPAHRRELLRAAFPNAALVVSALTLLSIVLDLVWRPVKFETEVLPNLLQPLIPLIALLLVGKPFRMNVERIALAADIAYTAVLTSRLFYPTGSTSGVALFLALKMVGTAVLFPWSVRLQVASSLATLGILGAGLLASGRTPDGGHTLVGPLIGAALGGVGVLHLDRTRRSLFAHGAHLLDSERGLRSRLRSERTLVDIAREISAVTELPNLLQRLCQRVASALTCDFAGIYLTNEQEASLIPAATYSHSEMFARRLWEQRAPFDHPLVQELLDGRTVIINDVARQTWIPREQLEAASIHNIVYAPVEAKGRLLGVVVAGRSSRWSPFDEQQVSLLKGLAAHAAVAIDNALLFQELAASEARYRDLFDRANDLIFVVEEAGPIRFANQAGLQFIGATAEQLGELRWQQFLSPASVLEQNRRMRIARLRGIDSGRVFEVEASGHDGTAGTLEVHARLISAPGKPRVYQCIARDVSERKRQDLETQRLLRELREANRLQAEFVANVSHELRTPLNVIIGYTDILSDDPNLPIGGEGRASLARIARATRALHRLVESVLEYARLDRGRTTLIPRPFTAEQLLLELRALCNDVLENPAVSVQFEITTGPVDFSTDYDRLYSALSNLLLNAIKFTPRGEVYLSVAGTAEHAEFVVRDTGIGIPPEEIEHVFEPFRQVDGSTTRHFGGVGLGLAIVRRNAQLLGGTVQVESQVGAGTTFQVRIPRVLRAARQSEDRAFSAA
jgi:PAS domain S-box-containing protein